MPDGVVFQDGNAESFDAIIAATGFSTAGISDRRRGIKQEARCR